MTDQRVYPRESPPDSGEHSNAKLMANSNSPSPPVSGEHQRHGRNMSQDSFASSKMSYGYGYGPNPGTYVVQIPKDQVYRVPPPENAHKFKLYTKKKAGRKGCRRCFCCIFAGILILAALLAVTGAVLYLVYKPKAPSYSIESVHVKGVNLSTIATSSTITPVFNVTLKSTNNNGKIGIYYEQGSLIKIYHDGLNLCNGKLPAFYQPPKSSTVFSTKLTGAGIVLSESARDKLLTQQKNGKVPLDINVKVPVKIKIGSIKTWTINIEVSCGVTVNALATNSKVVSKKCKVNAKPW
ncbi:NDR1/HIN1-like protein 13 [Chenopodium quinoa]|nr:NDR1/HIN1-like protein 13 [Chenopodium quinoa]